MLRKYVHVLVLHVLYITIQYITTYQVTMRILNKIKIKKIVSIFKEEK